MDIPPQINPDGLGVMVHQHKPAGVALGKRPVRALPAANVQGQTVQVPGQIALKDLLPVRIDDRGEILPRVRSRAGQFALNFLPALPNARIGCFLRHFFLPRV